MASKNIILIILGKKLFDTLNECQIGNINF